jgi:hypothetical protein
MLYNIPDCCENHGDVDDSHFSQRFWVIVLDLLSEKLDKSFGVVVKKLCLKPGKVHDNLGCFDSFTCHE